MSFDSELCKSVEEFECPHCHEHLIMNKRQYANHIRWCKSNPKYDEIRNRMISKLKEKAEIKHNELFHDHEMKCCICGNKYIINISDSDFNQGKYRKTCCDECAKQLTSQNTDQLEKAKKTSKTLLDKNKGCSISDTNQICQYCGSIFRSNRKKKYCCKECRTKARTEKQLLDKELFIRYKSQCVFNFALNEFPEEFDFNLIKEHGWYQAKNRGNNLTGISRDHMLSCKYGYDNLIDPYLISHPANCKLILQTQNSSKHSNCSITKEELIEKVNEWNNKYGNYPNKIKYYIIPEIIDRF